MVIGEVGPIGFARSWEQARGWLPQTTRAHDGCDWPEEGLPSAKESSGSLSCYWTAEQQFRCMQSTTESQGAKSERADLKNVGKGL